MYTPFDRRGAIDRTGLRRLVTHLIDAGSDGLAMTGNASESAWLDAGERCQLADWTAEAVGGRVPLIAGANAPDTADAIGFARHAISCGARTVFCGAPAAGPGSGPYLIRHFRGLADAISVPLMLQNSPSAPIRLNELLEAAQHPNIRYVKEWSLRAGHVLSAIRERAPDLDVYTRGKNPIEDVARGARGGIPVVWAWPTWSPATRRPAPTISPKHGGVTCTSHRCSSPSAPIRWAGRRRSCVAWV